MLWYSVIFCRTWMTIDIKTHNFTPAFKCDAEIRTPGRKCETSVLGLQSMRKPLILKGKTENMRGARAMPGISAGREQTGEKTLGGKVESRNTSFIVFAPLFLILPCDPFVPNFNHISYQPLVVDLMSKLLMNVLIIFGRQWTGWKTTVRFTVNLRHWIEDMVMTFCSESWDHETTHLDSY